MSAYDGKTCAVSFSIAAKGATVGTLVWKELGMMKTKSMKATWDTADSTADSTPDSSKTAIATRIGVAFSGDGVSYDDAAYNQRGLKDQFFNPAVTTAGQPEAWFKLEYESGESFTGFFLMTSWSDDSPEADVQTWSIEASAQGKVTYADGVA
ncbi:MAG: hypothetical protein KBG00_07970 [Rhodoferax sp.]|jgi:hypothetical protein|uniref:hypothetical protein n=1 Tax=Rhodoferax sp. TaxID=50421 RepID=UPI001B45165B|nr:hypothetical protein [Rhodoferax sp.]MBP9148705.1 hypothetical protein [Rhodoferax sp.]MBP9736261.1 hypothetical protein [Rhodoferax sp.]